MSSIPLLSSLDLVPSLDASEGVIRTFHLRRWIRRLDLEAEGNQIYSPSRDSSPGRKTFSRAGRSGDFSCFEREGRKGRGSRPDRVPSLGLSQHDHHHDFISSLHFLLSLMGYWFLALYLIV